MHLLKELINNLKFKSKPRITLGLQKSISMKDRLYKNFINFILTTKTKKIYSPPL